MRLASPRFTPFEQGFTAIDPEQVNRAVAANPRVPKYTEPVRIL